MFASDISGNTLNIVMVEGFLCLFESFAPTPNENIREILQIIFFLLISTGGSFAFSSISASSGGTIHMCKFKLIDI